MRFACRQQRFRGTLGGQQVVALLERERGFEGQLGHPQDAVHAGPDLVAGVGERLALGAAGGLHPSVGLAQLLLERSQFRIAGTQLFFQDLAVAFHVAVALLDGAGHLDEGVDRGAGSPISRLAGAQRVVLEQRHGLGRLSQLDPGSGMPAPCGPQRRKRRQPGQYQQDDRPSAPAEVEDQGSDCGCQQRRCQRSHQKRG